MLKDFDVWVRFQLLHQRFLYRAAGCVGRVHDTAVRMAAFTGEVQFSGIVIVPGERHALFEQPLDGTAAMLHHEAHRVILAQSRAGDMGVADVVGRGIFLAQHGGDATLCPCAGSIEELLLGEQRNLLGFGES